jgi:hypothetical protein
MAGKRMEALSLAMALAEGLLDMAAVVSACCGRKRKEEVKGKGSRVEKAKSTKRRGKGMRRADRRTKEWMEKWEDRARKVWERKQ